MLCGAAGQGIQTVEQLLTRVMKSAGYNVYATKEYMSRVRGGTNSTEIRVSSKKVTAYVDRIDILIPLSKDAIDWIRWRISSDTVIMGEEENITGAIDTKQYKTIKIPFTKVATEVGGAIYSNIIAAGLILGLFNVNPEITKAYLTKRFDSKGEKILTNNMEACHRGLELAKDLISSETLQIKIEKDSEVPSDILLDGTSAVGMGAIAGGCNFIYAYPMSPSTGVLTFLAQNSIDFGIVVEQAEDEVAVLNAVVGSWYAGGKGMCTTSDGGFALMGEAISLVGATESPAVIHLAQRIGPATGLPTRTAQSGLSLVLNAGHGFFPRVILAPGRIKDAFYLTQNAFNIADRYQVPVFILTDQYFVDSYYNLPTFDLKDVKIENHVVKTDESYKRYKLTESGISPRGIPGNGDGLVCVDSHTHDEGGHISEDLRGMRVKMVEKRFKKLRLLKENAIPPELIGPKDYKSLLIGWGSTFHAIEEALDKLGIDELAFLHFKQVYPLHESTEAYLGKAQQRIIIETNPTSQFGTLLKSEFCIKIEQEILKYNGLPFSVENICDNVEKILKG